MDIPIIYEDDDLIVINKPPGIVVNRAESVKEATVQDWAASRLSLPRKRESGSSTGSPTGPGMTTERDDFFDRAGIVHRTDKETSGLLLIAKTPPAFRELQRQFKEKMVKKTYLAIIHGKLVPPEGEIRAPVGRLPWNRERFGIVPGGRDAITKYKVIKLLNDISLVELYPETGRTHQIRVHLKYLNHPIIGDYLYAGRKTAREDRLWAPRVMLHAAKIAFEHPTSGKMVAFAAPMPDDMKRITKSD